MATTKRIIRWKEGQNTVSMTHMSQIKHNCRTVSHMAPLGAKCVQNNLNILCLHQVSSNHCVVFPIITFCQFQNRRPFFWRHICALLNIGKNILFLLQFNVKMKWRNSKNNCPIWRICWCFIIRHIFCKKCPIIGIMILGDLWTQHDFMSSVFVLSPMVKNLLRLKEFMHVAFVVH